MQAVPQAWAVAKWWPVQERVGRMLPAGAASAGEWFPAYWSGCGPHGAGTM